MRSFTTPFLSTGLHTVTWAQPHRRAGVVFSPLSCFPFRATFALRAAPFLCSGKTHKLERLDLYVARVTGEGVELIHFLFNQKTSILPHIACKTVRSMSVISALGFPSDFGGFPAYEIFCDLQVALISVSSHGVLFPLSFCDSNLKMVSHHTLGEITLII